MDIEVGRDPVRLCQQDVAVELAVHGVEGGASDAVPHGLCDVGSYERCAVGAVHVDASGDDAVDDLLDLVDHDAVVHSALRVAVYGEYSLTVPRGEFILPDDPQVAADHVGIGQGRTAGVVPVGIGQLERVADPVIDSDIGVDVSCIRIVAAYLAEPGSIALIDQRCPPHNVVPCDAACEELLHGACDEPLPEVVVERDCAVIVHGLDRVRDGDAVDDVGACVEGYVVADRQVGVVGAGPELGFLHGCGVRDQNAFRDYLGRDGCGHPCFIEHIPRVGVDVDDHETVRLLEGVHRADPLPDEGYLDGDLLRHQILVGELRVQILVIGVERGAGETVVAADQIRSALGADYGLRHEVLGAVPVGVLVDVDVDAVVSHLHLPPVLGTVIHVEVREQQTDDDDDRRHAHELDVVTVHANESK